MAFKMAPRSPLMKSLKGGQKNLPEGLKKAIEASPGKMMDSPAKQTANYYDIRPENARTQADSAAVETSYLGSKNLGEVAGKIASGGDINLDTGNITGGNTPNSQDAKDMKNELREVAKKRGKNPMDAYKSSPAKNMNKGYGSPAKNMNKGYGTPSPMKAEMALSIEDSNYKKEVKAAKKSSPAKQTTKGVIKKTVKITPKRKIKSTLTGKKKATKVLISKEVRNPVGGLNVKPASKTPKLTKSPAKKSKSKVEQDYARNAIADYKRGDKKAAGYEKKKALEVAAGEGK